MQDNQPKVKTIVQDEKENEKFQKKYYKVDFQKLARMVFSDLNDNKSTGILFNHFPKEKVIKALQNPQNNEETLRNLSNFLYISSHHYKRLCDYYAEMPTLDWYVEPYKLDTSKIEINKFKKQYNETLDELDNMNIKHEYMKCLRVAFREGIFYGYEHSTSDSYFIQKLDPDYCRISSVEDGVYNFQFNFSYFDTYKDSLNKYAQEFKIKYKEYQNSNNKKNSKKIKEPQWIELSSDKTICIKPDETILYPYPPFCGVFPELYEIQDYKALKKANTEMQNYAVLVGNIPYKKNSDMANDFGLELNTAIEFGNRITESLPNQVGFLLSVYDDMELFKLNGDKVGTDKVEESTNNFWSTTGVSKNLFTDSGNSDAAMKYSITTDIQTIFGILRQLERIINRKLKLTTRKYKFKINILDITRFNRKDIVAEELKVAQFGIPNKTRLVTSMGMSQSSINSMTFLENDILELHEKWIPLKSSHVQNGDVKTTEEEKGGKPSAEEGSDNK